MEILQYEILGFLSFMRVHNYLANIKNNLSVNLSFNPAVGFPSMTQKSKSGNPGILQHLVTFY